MIRILSALIFLLQALSTQPLAEPYPSKPIRLVVLFAAVAFGRYVREQLDTWGKLIRAAKIQPE